MRKFIKLTGKKNNELILLNPDHIFVAWKNGDENLIFIERKNEAVEVEEGMVNIYHELEHRAPGEFVLINNSDSSMIFNISKIVGIFYFAGDRFKSTISHYIDDDRVRKTTVTDTVEEIMHKLDMATAVEVK